MDNAIEEVVPNEKAAARPPQRLVEFVLPMVIVAVDQATKAMVRASVPIHDSVTVIPGFFNITHALNSGAAFGILDGADFPYKTVVIAVIATAALIGVGMYAASLSHHQLIARIGLALIVGGAAGNLIDRVLYDGRVTDFLNLGVGNLRTGIFNIADVVEVIGVLLFALYVQFHGDFGPGGGFQAGVILAAALIFYALIFGLADARDRLPTSRLRAADAADVAARPRTGADEPARCLGHRRRHRGPLRRCAARPRSGRGTSRICRISARSRRAASLIRLAGDLAGTHLIFFLGWAHQCRV
jgi:signal peptidase II